MNAYVRAVTFNCGCGNPAVTRNPGAFLALPFIDAVIDGDDSATIVALQEVSPDLKSVLALVDAHFQLLHISRPGQGNALLIPRRYELVEHDQARMAAPQAQALWRGLRGTYVPIAWRQIFELRMWQAATVRDQRTGQFLTVFCTHLSGNPNVRLLQARVVFEQIRRCPSPVLLLADLNVRPWSPYDEDREILHDLIPPLMDMEVNDDERKAGPLDWILGRGLERLASRVHTDITVSDHHPKEATMRFVGRGGAPTVPLTPIAAPSATIPQL